MEYVNMDINKALELIESGRFEELDIDDIWELINVLSISSEPQAFQALVKLQNSKIGQSLPQMNMQMKYIMEQNIQALNKIEKDFNLFEMDKKGNPIQAEVLPIFNFFSHVEVKNKDEAEKVQPQKLFEQAVSIAKLTAKKDIVLDKNFSKQKPEEQQKTYANTVLMAMEETAFVLVSNQILEDTLAQKHTPLSKADKEEISAKAEKRFSEVINPKSKTSFQLTNSNIISTFSAEINRAGNKAALVEKNTTFKGLNNEVAKVDKKLEKEYPETMQLLRPLAQYQNIAFLAGSQGRNVFGADCIAQTVHENNPAKGQKEVSLFAFLKEQPAKIKSFSQNIVRSIKKAYTFMAEAVSLKLSSEKIADGFKNMFSFFSRNKEDKNAKYNGIDAKTMNANLHKMSVYAGDNLLAQSRDDKKIIAWKDFHKLYNSQLGQAMRLNSERLELMSERIELTPDNVKDYTKVTPIVLSKKTKSPKTLIGKAINKVMLSQKTGGKVH